MSKKSPKKKNNVENDILVIKDREEGFQVQHDPFNLPMRGIIIGKSQYSGKSNLLGNLITRPFDDDDEHGMNYYRKYFKPENIYIISPSLHIDQKLQNIIELLEIPWDNLSDHYDELKLKQLYLYLEQNYKEAVDDGREPEHSLIILDDCSFSGDLKSKQHGIINRLFSNGRHVLISTILTAQKLTSVLPTARENCTFCVLFSCSDHQLKLAIEDHSLFDRPIKFKRLFREVTDEPYSYLVINYQNKLGNGRYMDSKFRPVDTNLEIF